MYKLCLLSYASYPLPLSATLPGWYHNYYYNQFIQYIWYQPELVAMNNH